MQNSPGEVRIVRTCCCAFLLWRPLSTEFPSVVKPVNICPSKKDTSALLPEGIDIFIFERSYIWFISS